LWLNVADPDGERVSGSDSWLRPWAVEAARGDISSCHLREGRLEIVVDRPIEPTEKEMNR
jgi:hypothetical protein